MTDPIQQAFALGQSIWYDGIRRSLFASGDLERMVAKEGLRGMTSNPSIFEAAIAGSSDYAEAIAELRSTGPRDAKSAYESLAISDIRAAADIFRPVYEDSGGSDGFVSMEVSPELAHDTAGSAAEARRLWSVIDRPNVMIKVPATPAGIPVIQELTGAGINVNVTLLFGLEAYESAVQAYLAGLEDRLGAGGDLGTIASVASVFVSRLDAALEARLGSVPGPAHVASAHTTVAIANAKVIYARFRQLFSGPRWDSLAGAGARPQRLLWASTSTKSPALPELLYVESLMGPDTVDTLPPATFEAFRARGRVHSALEEDMEAARAILEGLPDQGIDLAEVTDQLLSDGVDKFQGAFRKLLSSLEEAVAGPSAKAEPWRLHRCLPAELTEQMNAALGEWRATDKTTRLWAHDATVWTGGDEAAWLGWLGVALDQAAHAQRFETLAKEVADAGFTDAVVLGMGGSSLCPEVLANTFPSRPGLPRLHVLDSTDPAQVKAIQTQLDLASTLFFVSSKSGTTLEPNIFAAYFYQAVSKVVGEERAGSHFVAITDPGSPLEDLARTQRYRAVFAGVPSIGGRYSALSNFGMVPAAASGIDVVRLFESAETMAHACAPSVPARDNPGLVLGALIGAAVNAGRDKLTLVTSPGLSRLGAWLEQLLAESTGKHGRGVIPVDREPLGAPEAYGSDRLFAYISLAGDHDSDLEAKISALEAAGQPVVRIELSDPYQLGREFFRWEFATAVAGSIIGIDPFDQPDVEEAKVSARRLTDAYDRNGSLAELDPFFEGDGAALYADSTNQAALAQVGGEGPSLPGYLGAHLGRAGTGDYVAVLAYVPMTEAHEAVLTGIRTAIRDARRVATCVGFGPRFQHSTGQAYKGGPNTGVFLQITCDDTVVLPVPGHRFSFGVVKEAEARSDLEVLAQRGRRALRVHLGPDVAAGLEVIRAAVTEGLLSVSTRA
ncbi:MAG TPA: bifunctional transaldolase/phosoglucose isomerase [Acidimicrobiales bacterium]|nr:bifunctional transaldolase/phosoglucose isomerase [Acidimicrobiales bacterium]